MPLPILPRAIVMLVALLAACLPAAGQTVTWTGAGDGTSWSQASNWSPAAVPTSTSDVVIPAGPTTVTINAAASARSLTLSRALNMSGTCPSLTLTAGLNLATVQGVLTTAQSSCDSLIFSGTQSITGPGRIALRSGPMRVIGAGATLTIAAGTTVANTGGLSTIAVGPNASLLNTGTITATGGGGVSITGPSFTNAPGGLIQALSSSALSISTATWSNQGQLTINGGFFDVTASTASLGAVTRTNGTLQLLCPYTGPTLTATSATGSITLGNAFTATGVTFATEGTGALVVNGAVTWNACTVASPVTMGTSCGGLRISGGLTLAPGSAITTGDSSCDHLIFTGTQTVSGSGEIRLNRGYGLVQSAGSELTIAPGVTVHANPIASFTQRTFRIASGATLINRGTLRASNNNSLTLGGSATPPISGTLINQPGGVILAETSGRVTFNVTSWTNNGDFVLNNGGVGLSGTYSAASFGNVLGTGGTLQLFGTFQTGPTLSVPPGPAYELNCNLTNVAVTAQPGATLSVRSGTFTNCSFNGAATIPISGAALNNCTFNAPIITTGTFVTMASPVFNAPATLGSLTITGGITVNGVTLTRGDGGVGFSGGTQSISGSGTLVGIPAVVESNTTLILPSTITILADTSDINISLGRNARLDSSAAIYASGRAVRISHGYTDGVSDFINRGTITLVNGASLVFAYNLRWQNLGVIATSTGVNLNFGGVYTTFGNIDQTAGAPNITLAGNFAVSGPLDIDTFPPSTVWTTSLNGVTINSSSGRTFTANLGSSFTNCTFNTPVTIGGTTGGPVHFTDVHFYRPLTMGSTNGIEQADFRGTITLHNTDVYMTNCAWGALGTSVITGTGTFHCNNASIIGAGTSLTVDSGITVLAEPYADVYSSTCPVTFRGLIRGQVPTGGVGLGGAPLHHSGRTEVSDGASLTLFSPINTGSISMLRGSNLIVNGTYPSLGVLERDAARTGNLTFNGTFNPGPTFVLTPNVMPAVFKCNASGVTFSATEGQTYTISGGFWSNCRWNAPVTFGGPNINAALTTLESAVFDADAVAGQLNVIASRFGLTLLNNHTFTLKDNAEMTFAVSPIQGNGRILFGPGLSSLRPEDGPITIGAGITITNQGGDGRIRPGSGNPTCINNGTIRASGAGRSIFIDYVSPNPVMANYGTMQADAGSSLVQRFNVENYGLIRVMPGGAYAVETGAYLRMRPGSTLETQLDGSASAPATPPVTVRGRLIAGATFAVAYASGSPQACVATRPLVATQGAGTLEGSFAVVQPPTSQGAGQPSVTQTATGISYSQLSRADVGSPGAVAQADGLLDNNDFIVFCNLFFSLDADADLGVAGGFPGQDGLFDNNDFIAFVNLFFAGC